MSLTWHQRSSNGRRNSLQSVRLAADKEQVLSLFPLPTQALMTRGFLGEEASAQILATKTTKWDNPSNLRTSFQGRFVNGEAKLTGASLEASGTEQTLVLLALERL